MDNIMYYACVFLAVLLSISLHEFAHGFVSFLLGDPTPKLEHRLSLNPIRHLDPIGALCMFFFHIGWAKPVMINPGYYKKPKLGIALVGLAGPFMNVITAFIAYIGMGFMEAMVYRGSLSQTTLIIGIYTFLYYFAMLSIYQAVFNLVPVPPLDGSKILAYFLPDSVMEFYSRYDRYFMIALLVLIYFNILNLPLDAIYQFVSGGMQGIASALFSGLTVTSI